MKDRHFLKHLDHDAIVAAIAAAETKTSGEIRLFITRHSPADVMAAAQHEFDRLRMHKTKDRNGVLIFVAPQVHKFAIIGDTAVHARCGDDFWTQVAAEMTTHFKTAQYTQAILHAIQKAGELLAEHFPRRAEDQNQLSNEIAHD